jgi:hypothetical protein
MFRCCWVYHAAHSGIEWITLALAVIIQVLYCHSCACVLEVRNRQPGMTTLITAIP